MKEQMVRSDVGDGDGDGGGGSHSHASPSFLVLI
jgi:hypothetical protein